MTQRPLREGQSPNGSNHSKAAIDQTVWTAFAPENLGDPFLQKNEYRANQRQQMD